MTRDEEKQIRDVIAKEDSLRQDWSPPMSQNARHRSAVAR